MVGVVSDCGADSGRMAGFVDWPREWSARGRKRVRLLARRLAAGSVARGSLARSCRVTRGVRASRCGRGACGS